MFTGIITDVGRVAATARRGDGARIRIACGYEPGSIKLGASIACAGPCLTVVETGRLADGSGFFEVDASGETLKRTTLGTWREGTRVNLERALSAGDELGGHIVTGHIDAVAEIAERSDEADGAARFVVAAPQAVLRYIAEKGSVALDGVSLTVNEVEDSGELARFAVTLIPHTLKVTTWGERRAGDRVNLEVDVIARYLERLRRFD
jgi:riboflavin synthase